MQRLAKLDQKIEEVDDSMVGVTLSVDDSVYGIDPYGLGIDVEPHLAWGELMLPSDFLVRQLAPEPDGWRPDAVGWTHPTRLGTV